MIVWSSVSSSTTIPVSREVKFFQIFAGVTTSEGIKVKRPHIASISSNPRVASENSTNNNSETVQDRRDTM